MIATKRVSSISFLMTSRDDRGMQRVECPPGSRSECKEIMIGRLPARMCDAASKLVVKAFPRMDIPVDFWKKKICSDVSIGAMENKQHLIGVANVSNREMGKANLDLLAIDPSYQGKGLGSKLLVDAEKVAAKAGYRVMGLMTEQVKPQNVAFYSSRGYKVIGYDPRGYEHSPSVKFEKNI